MKLRNTLAALALLSSGSAIAGGSANIAFSSDYLFRGLTQTGYGAAVSGGMDYESDSGFYAGTWVSTLGEGAGAELDLYTGFSGEASGIGYDVGIISYIYPTLDDSIEEWYLGVSYGMFGLTYWREFDGDYDYIEGNLDFSIGEDMSLGLHLGSTSFDGGGDYMDYNVSITKPYKDIEWSMMLSDTDIDGDDYTVVVSASYGFDL